MKKETTTKKRPRNAFSSALIFQIRILFSTLIPSFLFTFHPSSRMCLQILFTVNFYYSTFVCCFFSFFLISCSLFLLSLCTCPFGRSVSHAMSIKETKLCHDDFVRLDCNKYTRCVSIEN